MRIIIRLHLDLTPEQEARYRREHDLGPDESLRDHVRDLVLTELTGLGEDWWDVRVY